MTPSVSIILPTYNRENFLVEAFDAICQQEHTDWELVVVDDGSTDKTQDLVKEWQQKKPQTIRYAHQENAGAYAARNHGLDLVSGDLIAFYDSDDLWTPEHLSGCVQALKENKEIDWVMGYATRIDASTHKIIDHNTFRTVDGAPKALLNLKSEKHNDAHIVTDEQLLERAINPGFSFELHTAVIRSNVFKTYRFKPQYRNGQDRFAFFAAILAGHRMAYINKQHLIYRIHGNNDSLVRTKNSSTRREQITSSIITQYQQFAKENQLTKSQQQAVTAKVASTLFWGIGYHVYLTDGDFRNALRYFAQGIWYQPSNLTFYKTTLATLLKWILSIGRRPQAEQR